MGEVTRTLLVGEVDPHSSDPRMALHVEPAGAAGSRLARILGLSPQQYLDAFDRANLCGGGWDGRVARAAADAVFAERAGRTSVVLLGARVCRAFGVAFEPFTAFEMTRVLGGRTLTLRGCVLPHPSGRCRVWNDPASAVRAVAAVAAVADPCVSCGEPLDMCECPCERCGSVDGFCACPAPSRVRLSVPA